MKRFTREARRFKTEIPYRRMESLPRDEMQVDFGQGAWVVIWTAGKRRPHLFRAVLSHSRKGYTEVVASGHGVVRAASERVPRGGRGHEDGSVRQPEGGGHPSGLVRSVNLKLLAEFAKFGDGTVVRRANRGCCGTRASARPVSTTRAENAVKGRRFPESLGAQNIYLAGERSKTWPTRASTGRSTSRCVLSS